MLTQKISFLFLILLGFNKLTLSSSGFTSADFVMTVYDNSKDEKSRIEILKKAIDNGIDVNSSYFGDTALFGACIRGLVSTVRFLIDQKAKVNLLYTEERITVLLATLLSDEKNTNIVAKLLIDAGAEVNVNHNIFSTPLHLAIKRRDKGLAQYIIDKGASLTVKFRGETALALALKIIKRPSKIKKIRKT